MRVKFRLAMTAAGVGLLFGMITPSASASTSPSPSASASTSPAPSASASTSPAPSASMPEGPTNSASSPTKAPPATLPDQAYFYLCNLTSGGEIYGCAKGNGYLAAVTLVDAFDTTFSYNATTEHFQQESTDLCLEYNSGSSQYPVRMDTCTDHRASQEWFTSGYGADQLENGYSGTCLEGSETDGYGHPLTMSACSNRYPGENWIAA